MMVNSNRMRLRLLAATLVAVAWPAAAQVPPADPPVVTVTPVPPEDPGLPSGTGGIVTPPIVVTTTTTPPPPPTTPPPPPPPPTTPTPPPPPATTEPPVSPTTTTTTTTTTPPETGQPALPPPATSADVTPAALPDPAATEGVADPGWTQVGFVPTARPLREGDMFAQILGYMGAFGIQYGVTGDLDISAGLSIFTLELAAKYSFYHNDYMAISAIAEIIFPFYANAWPLSGEDSMGLKYMMMLGFGPLFSLWNETFELDVGLLMIPAMQWPAEECFDKLSTATPTDDTYCTTEPFDTDFAVMPYVYGSVSLAGYARLMLGFEHIAVAARDEVSCPEGDGLDAGAVCRRCRQAARDPPAERE